MPRDIRIPEFEIASSGSLAGIKAAVMAGQSKDMSFHG